MFVYVFAGKLLVAHPHLAYHVVDGQVVPLVYAIDFAALVPAVLMI